MLNCLPNSDNSAAQCNQVQSMVASAAGGGTTDPCPCPRRSPPQAVETEGDGAATGQAFPFNNNSNWYHLSSAKTYFYERAGKACTFWLSVTCS